MYSHIAPKYNKIHIYMYLILFARRGMLLVYEQWVSKSDASAVAIEYLDIEAFAMHQPGDLAGVLR